MIVYALWGAFMVLSKSSLVACAISVGVTFCSVTGAFAGTVTGGSLLDGAGADQLENWLGLGDQDFTNIFTGNAGVATATDFHKAVDGVGPTFSIYGVTLGDGSFAKIGGYTALDWGGPSGYAFDATAFIFNLTTSEAQFIQHYNAYSMYRNSVYFATFGGGHDIFGGSGVLGTCGGTTISPACDGYTASHSYDQSQGQISIAGDSGYYAGDSGYNVDHIRVNSLEVYTFAPAATVPLPAGGVLLLTALGGLVLARRRRWSAP